MTDPLLILACLVVALLLDHLLGEPKRFHPLVLFGKIADQCESSLNQQTNTTDNIVRGGLAWAIAVMPIVLIFAWFSAQTSALVDWAYYMLQALILYLCIGWRSLKEHMLAIYTPLHSNNLTDARQACAMIVSRDTENMNEDQIAKAAIESTLENGPDGIYGAIFWFAVLGAPGAVLYRLSNTLDAMWGYRTQQYETFGKWAAKIDDLLNWIPARITTYIYLGSAFFDGKGAAQTRIKQALQNRREQAPLLASPNGGPVMVTGASLLDISLGGPTSYHGEIKEKPLFGGTQKATAKDIYQALKLVDRSLIGWIAIAFVIMLTTR